MRKSTEFGADFQAIVDGITNVVYDIVDVSRRTMETTNKLGKEVKNEGELVIQDLEVSSKNLEDLGMSMIQAPSKGLKQNMASCSYEIGMDNVVNLCSKVCQGVVVYIGGGE
jgi:hypothetical protein